SSTCASAKWPMRAFAMTGILTASWISRTLAGSAMRATPPSRWMSAGTRSCAMTAHAPVRSEHPDEPVADVDQAALAQLVHHLRERLPAGADHLGQLDVGEADVD